MRKPFRSRAAVLGTLLVAGSLAAPASDHDDTALLVKALRHDARITDLHTFVRGSNLVLALSLNPMIGTQVAQASFPADLVLRLYLDNDSRVAFADPADLAEFGGTVARPGKIEEDRLLEITFDGAGQPQLELSGFDASAGRDDESDDERSDEPREPWVALFAGLRDDPFIRGPRIGRNIAAVVVELPLAAVLEDQSTLLVWASAAVDDIHGPYQELGGRSLRSQFVENELLNTLHPRHHRAQLGIVPDVVILDTSRPVAFPNGRELEDDVVDLVGDPRVLNTDAPFPSANDLPFLSGFPYLAPPHPPSP